MNDNNHDYDYLIKFLALGKMLPEYGDGDGGDGGTHKDIFI